MKNALLIAASVLVLAACDPAADRGPSPSTDVTASAADILAKLEQLEAGAFPHEVSDLAPDPAVRYGRLDNGMRYAIMENTTPPQQAAVRLRFDTGSLNETEPQQGLAHFLEHMAFNGSTNVPEGEMVQLLERYGLAFGPDTNAFTSFDQTVYQLDLPEVGEDILDTALFIMRETASELLLDAEAIDRERGVIKSEERFRNSPGLRRIRDLWSFVFPDARFPDRFPIGTLEVIDSAPRDEFVDYYQKWYTPDRAFLTVVGDIDADVIEAKIEDQFGDWQAADGVDRTEASPGQDSPASETEADIFVDPDVTTTITMAATSPVEKKIDSAQARREAVIEDLAFRIFDRRLAKITRTVDAPFFQAFSSSSNFYDAAELVSLNVFAEPERWDAALSAAEQELRRALEFGFTEAELAEQLANYRTSLKTAADGAATRQSTTIADRLAQAINGDMVFSHPSSALERFDALAETLTVAQVTEAFRDTWGDTPLRLHVSLPEEPAGGADRVLEVYNASTEIAVEAPQDAGVLAFAYEDFGTPGEIVEREEVAGLDVVRLRFENNVWLNFKQTDFEDETVRVRLRFGGGQLEQPAGQPGLDVLMDVAFADGGLEAHSRDELQSIFAGRDVTFNISSGFDAFVGSAATNRDDLRAQLAVWAAFMTAPGFREEGKAQYDQLVNTVYPTIDASPQGVQSIEVPKLIRGGDERFGLPSQEALASRSFDELRAFLEVPSASGFVEVTIVGDITEEAAIEAVATTIGSLPERAASRPGFEDQRNVSFPVDKLGTIDTLRHDGEPNRALALIYWPGVDNFDREVSSGVRLMEGVMGLKLIERIREELGATYSPSSNVYFDDVNPGYGYISVSLDLEPGDVDDLFSVVFEIAEEMRSGDITEDERSRALQPILEQIEEQVENNGYWLGLLDEATSSPNDLQEHLRRAENFQAVTVDDLVALSNTYLARDKAYRIQILPTDESSGE